MEDKTAKIIIGILGVLLILSNGVQYTLNDTGKNLRCSTGWQFQESGDNDGKYMCQTESSTRYAYCSRVWDTKTGRTNYWCAEAVPLLLEKDDLPSQPNGLQWDCIHESCVIKETFK